MFFGNESQLAIAKIRTTVSREKMVSCRVWLCCRCSKTDYYGVFTALHEIKCQGDQLWGILTVFHSLWYQFQVNLTYLVVLFRELGLYLNSRLISSNHFHKNLAQISYNHCCWFYFNSSGLALPHPQLQSSCRALTSMASGSVSELFLSCFLRFQFLKDMYEL